MIELILAGVSATASYLEAEQQKKVNEQKAAAISKAYKDNMLSAGEIAFRSNQVGDVFDTSMQETANAAATNARSILNPQVVRTMAMSKIQGQKLQAITEQKMKDENFNLDMGLKSKLAGADGIMPDLSWASGIVGGIQGYTVGSEINKGIAMTNLYENEFGKKKKVKTGASSNPEVDRMYDNMPSGF